jgi:hypothetical protein
MARIRGNNKIIGDPAWDNLFSFPWIKNGYFSQKHFYSITAERGTISIPFSFILGIIFLMDLIVEG